MEFQAEAKDYVDEIIATLEDIESDLTDLGRLEHVGLLADRIMGTAKSLLAQGCTRPGLEELGAYGEICKLVSYKGSQIANRPELANIVVALLLDAAETMQALVARLASDGPSRPVDATSGGTVDRVKLDTMFLDRLRWIASQFGENLRGTVGSSPSATAQTEIDALLKKLGIKS